MPNTVLTKLVVLLLIGTLLAGCKPSTNPTPTVSTEPFAVENTQTPVAPLTPGETPESPQATKTVSTATVLTPIVLEQPTMQVTIDAAATQDGIKYPSALLQVEKPGEMSRLISPILVSANVYPGAKGLVNVQLIGEDGRIMADQLLQLSTTETGWKSLATWIQFEINSAGESALIVVSTRDGNDRRIAQESVPVILLQVGENEIENPIFFTQPVVLSSPVNGGFAKNGSLHIEGQVRLINENPIILELISQTGGVVASKAIMVKSIAGQDYVSFATDLDYAVSQRTSVRLIIRQPATLIFNVDAWLYSLVLFLDP
jgi:hypothetical protein